MVPDGMTSAEEVRAAIDKAEDDFQRCWDFLEVMKCGPIPLGFGEQFLAFQPMLAGALFRLDALYRGVRKAERATIAAKRRTNAERFASQMRAFGEFRSAIKSALDVGRSLGDAFAWFLYRRSQNRIAEHLQHPPIPHTPPGLGGQAELAFVDKFRYAGCVAIYHGITSFLRIGDVSFIDLRSGEVIALGELKARKVGPGEAVVTVNMISTGSKRVPFGGIPVAPGAVLPEPPEAQRDFAERLERQIAEMRAALRLPQDTPPPGVPDGFSKSHDFFDGYHISSLQNLADSLKAGDVAYEHVGPSLLLVGLNVMPEGRLSNRLFRAGEIDFDARLEKVVGQAVKLVHSKSRDNSIRLGAMSTGFLLGCSPPFWLPVDVGFLRKLYFQGAVVQTIYNPAHMLERFREAGFTVAQSEDRPCYQIEKLMPPDRRFVLENSNWFLAAIQGHLMKEERVIECVVTIMEKMVQGNLPANTKVEILINTHVFPQTRSS